MGLTVRKLLEVYFEKWQLQNVLESIDEPVSGNIDDLANKILQEWEPHRKNKYDLFAFLERSTLSRICEAYGLDYRGNKGVLIKRIKKSRLLDADFINTHSNESHSSEKRNEASKNLSTRKFINRRNMVIIAGVLITATTIGSNFTTIIDFFEKRFIPEPSNDEVMMLNQQIIDCNTFPDGESGFNYVNKTLGFMISWPNLDWILIKDQGKHRQNYGLESDESFLGGISVSREAGYSIVVAVFDSSDPIKNDFSRWIELQKEGYALKLQDMTNSSYVAPEKNSARLEIHGFTRENGDFKMEERLLKYSDRIYLIQKHIMNPQKYPQNYSEEAEEVRISFRLLSNCNKS